MFNEEHFYLIGQIQTSEKGGQPYSDNFPNGKTQLRKNRNLSNEENDTFQQRHIGMW